MSERNTETVATQSRARMCATCGSEKSWCDCWNCGGDGYSHHDCGEDCCCCLEPEDNVRCDNCHGKGGYLICPHCHPGAFDD